MKPYTKLSCHACVAQVASTPGVKFHAQGILSEKELAATPEGEREKYTTLQRSMADISVGWVDVLKIDVEGAEWPIFMEYFDAGTCCSRFCSATFPDGCGTLSGVWVGGWVGR